MRKSLDVRGSSAGPSVHLASLALLLCVGCGDTSANPGFAIQAALSMMEGLAETYLPED